MEYVIDPPIKHFARFPRWESVVPDNSMVSEFKKCPRRYFYRYVLGYTDKLVPQYFPFGTAYHKFRETLEQEFAKHQAAGLDVPTSCGLSYLESINAAKQCWEKEIAGVELKPGKFEFLTWARLNDSCAYVFDLWQREKKIGQIKVLASEQAFMIPLADGTQIGGRFDEIIEKDGQVMGRDFKTTTIQLAYYKKGLVPNSQFMLYTKAESMLHGKPIKGQLVEVLSNMKTTKPNMQTFPVYPNREQMAEWERGMIYWIGEIRKAREEDHYPMNESACWSCPFHSVCSMPSETSRSVVLKSNFRFKLWNYNEPSL